ncbi:MAG: T9SS type A sorting domain-containing protein [Flammeovirgaceae bacterium]|nr:T9SS type A sorting domain-containing protein [Flammeovirgaceae bacterium]
MVRGITFFLLVISLTSHGQIVERPLLRTPPSINSARLQSVPLTIPFWDDFSTNATGFPDDSSWVINSSTAWINTGAGVNPPSINVATLDGLNANGNPYASEDANGYTDELTSRPIDLSNVPPIDKDSIYLSFFFQWRGNSNTPEGQDFLALEFKDSTGIWTEIARFQNTSGTYDPTVFYDTLFKVTGTYLYDEFQFQFRSFGRQNGAYDSWHLDYIYLGYLHNPVVISFADRAITSYLTPLFGKYMAVPLTHFDSIFSDISFGAYNLHHNKAKTVNYLPEITITNYDSGQYLFGNTVTTPDSLPLSDVLNGIGPLERVTSPINEIDQLNIPSNFSSLADSITISIEILLNTKDGRTGDADHYNRFDSLNFKVNDFTQTTYILNNFYAYDDGKAENFAYLNQPGMIGAYRFDLQSNKTDTLVGVHLYIPYVGGTPETSSNMMVQVYEPKSGDGDLDSLLYEELIPASSQKRDTFLMHKFLQSVVVSGSFYFAWKSDVNGNVYFGLDKNTDSGDRMKYYLNGQWNQNTDIQGSLMIRPYFGKSTVVTSNEEDIGSTIVFPNPNRGVFYLSRQITALHIINNLGQPVNHSVSQEDNKTKIELTDPIPGIYLIRYKAGQKFITSKLVVQ